MKDKTLESNNKERLCRAIHNLEDCAFGMMVSYVPLCYSYDRDDYIWDEQKKECFVRDLVRYANQKTGFVAELERPIYLFFDLSIKFVAAVCRFSEQEFVSLRKIAETINKTEPGQKCTYEFLIEHDIELVCEEFNEIDYRTNYKEFVDTLKHVDNDLLVACIKYALQEYVDDHSLSAFSDTEAINDMILRINRTTSIMLVDMRKRESSLRVVNDEG